MPPARSSGGNLSDPARHQEEVARDVEARRADDRELARRSVAGEVAAQRAILEAYRRRVHRVIYRIMGSNRDVDDVLQDSFIEIFRSLPGFRGDAQLGTWIDRIAVRVGYRALIERRRRDRTALELVTNEGELALPPDSVAEAREAVRRLYAVLGTVEERHRIAFVLHVVDGRPLREVADMMDATTIATKLRVWRTRQRVHRAALGDPVLSAYVLSPGKEPAA